MARDSGIAARCDYGARESGGAFNLTFIRRFHLRPHTTLYILFVFALFR
jgi:hypothetical protein